MFKRTGATMKVIKASLDFRDLSLDTEKVFPKLETRIASIKEITLDPSKYFYFRNRAVSALEIHGPNDNGDAFEESELIRSYASFINSRESIDHNGEDITGMILDSAWIPFKGIHRPGVGIIGTNLLDFKQGDQLIGGWVENIHAMEREVAEERHPGIIQAMLNGEVTDTSMGCYCQSAICSICGNEATNEREYCEHIAYKGRKIAVAGKEVPVFEKNRGIVFFEDSVILPFHFGGIAGGQGADPKAKHLQVFCSAHPTNLKSYIVNRSLQALASDDYYKVGDKPDSFDDNKKRLEEEHKKKVDKVLNRTKDEREESKEDLEKADEKFQDEIDELEQKEASRRSWTEIEIKKQAYKERAMDTQEKRIARRQFRILSNRGKVTLADDWKNPGWGTLTFRPRSDKQGEELAVFEDKLHEKGISFDTGGSIDGSRDLELDWSLKGATPQQVLDMVEKSIPDIPHKFTPMTEEEIKDYRMEESEDESRGKTVNFLVDQFHKLTEEGYGLAESLEIITKEFGTIDPYTEEALAVALKEEGFELPEKLNAAKKEEKPDKEKPAKKDEKPIKDEKTPSEKAFDYILKAILPKKDGGEGKSFADAQKEAMKLFGEEVKQEKFDQMKKEKELKSKGKDHKMGKIREAMATLKSQAAEWGKAWDVATEKFFHLVDDEGMDEKEAFLEITSELDEGTAHQVWTHLKSLGVDLDLKDIRKTMREIKEPPAKAASLKIEAQKARMIEKLSGFFDGKPMGKSQEENLFNGEAKGQDKPLNPFQGKEAPGERGKAEDPFKGKEAPGERGKAEDPFKGKELPGERGKGNMFKELTSKLEATQAELAQVKKELSLAKLKASVTDKKANEFQAKFNRAMKAYDVVDSMVSKGMIAPTEAKISFEDLVNSTDDQLVSTSKLVAMFKGKVSRPQGLREQRLASIREMVPEQSTAIAAPSGGSPAGDGMGDIGSIFME